MTGTPKDNSGRNSENAAEQARRERERAGLGTKDEGERRRQDDVQETE